jgi:hypothetical protein
VPYVFIASAKDFSSRQHPRHEQSRAEAALRLGSNLFFYVRDASAVTASAVSSAFGFGFLRLSLGALLTGLMRIGTFVSTELTRAVLAALLGLLLGVLTITKLARIVRVCHDVALLSRVNGLGNEPLSVPDEANTRRGLRKTLRRDLIGREASVDETAASDPGWVCPAPDLGR